MRKHEIVLTFVCAVSLAGASLAAAATDPLAQARADLARLTADAATAETTIAADAQAGNLAQLERDVRTARATLKGDEKLLLGDAKAARKAGAHKTELRSLLHAARTQLKQFRTAVRTAFAQAKGGAKSKKGSKGSGSEGSSSSQGSDEDGPG